MNRRTFFKALLGTLAVAVVNPLKLVEAHTVWAKPRPPQPQPPNPWVRRPGYVLHTSTPNGYRGTLWWKAVKVEREVLPPVINWTQVETAEPLTLDHIRRAVAALKKNEPTCCAGYQDTPSRMCPRCELICYGVITRYHRGA